MEEHRAGAVTTSPQNTNRKEERMEDLTKKMAAKCIFISGEKLYVKENTISVSFHWKYVSSFLKGRVWQLWGLPFGRERTSTQEASLHNAPLDVDACGSAGLCTCSVVDTRDVSLVLRLQQFVAPQSSRELIRSGLSCWLLTQPLTSNLGLFVKFHLGLISKS